MSGVCTRVIPKLGSLEHWAVWFFLLKACSHLLQKLVFVLRALCYILCDGSVENQEMFKSVY